MLSGNFRSYTILQLSYLFPTLFLRRSALCNYLSSEPRFINNLSGRQEKSRICPRNNPRDYSLAGGLSLRPFLNFIFFEEIKHLHCEENIFILTEKRIKKNNKIDFSDHHINLEEPVSVY